VFPGMHEAAAMVTGAIAWLLGQGAERIAYVDVDAHHGDGVERAFWNDPRVPSSRCTA